MTASEQAVPSTRPTVDVVVPFAGPAAELERLRARLAGLRLAEGDSLTVVDNRAPGPRSGDHRHAAVAGVAARERAGSYFARNAGAALGAAEWLLFVDADVEAPADLLDRYFAPAPSERTAGSKPPIASNAARRTAQFAVCA